LSDDISKWIYFDCAKQNYAGWHFALKEHHIFEFMIEEYMLVAPIEPPSLPTRRTLAAEAGHSEAFFRSASAEPSSDCWLVPAHRGPCW